MTPPSVPRPNHAPSPDLNARVLPVAGDPDPSAAWAARYREYLERATARAVRAQDLNREVTRRVAGGELAPSTLESQLNAFLAANSVSYSHRLSGMTMRFLTGLIQTGTTYSYELVEAVVPGAVERPDAVAPEFDPAEWADWFTRLTEFAAGENSRVTAMLRTVMDQVASGDLAPTEVEEVSSVFHTERVPESTSRLVGLYLDLLSGLDEVHARFGEDYLRIVLGDLPGEAVAPSDDTVEFEAPLGETTSIRLGVSNDDLGPAAVRCTLTEVRRADGVGPAFEPVFTTTPERFELAPGAEATVELTLAADAHRFEPGALYVGVFRVASHTRTLLELPLRIRVTPTPQPATP